MRNVLIACILAATHFSAAAHGQSTGTQHPAVALPRTQLRTIHSRHVGQDYQLRIWLPEEYTRDANARFPAMYLLDGDLLFGTASEAAQYLQWGRMLPPLIVVGIGYGSIHSPENGGTNMRTRDMSAFPEQAAYVKDGGAKFLAFIRDELIPYVDRELRTDTSDRVLAGFSRGADFTVATLFAAPELFRRYIAIDSYYDAYFRLANDYAATGKDLPKTIFLSSRFPRSGVQEFAAHLKSRFPSVEVHYADAAPRHFAAGAEGLVRGMKTVFNRTSVYETLLPLARDAKVETVIGEYQRLKTTEPRTYNFGEMELVELGNALVLMKRADDAVEVYKLNLASYPSSAPTHSRLGTAYERLGNKPAALEHFRRALELNPADRFAADAIKRLESGR